MKDAEKEKVSSRSSLNVKKRVHAKKKIAYYLAHETTLQMYRDNQKQLLASEDIIRRLREAQEEAYRRSESSAGWTPNPKVVGTVNKVVDDGENVAKTIRELILTPENKQFDAEALNKLACQAQVWRNLPRGSLRISGTGLQVGQL